MLAAIIAALGTVPVVLYSFEDLHDPTIDATGTCNLTVPAATKGAPQIQEQGIGSVGHFAVFGSASTPVAANSRISWQAASCAPRAGAKGRTIEFLLHPTPQCFMRGGSATRIGGRPPWSSHPRWPHVHGKATDDVADDDGVLDVKFEGESVSLLTTCGAFPSRTARGTTSPSCAMRRRGTSTSGSARTSRACARTARRARGAKRAKRARLAAMAGVGTVIDQANPVVLCAGVDELAVYERTDAVAHLRALCGGGAQLDAVRPARPGRPGALGALPRRRQRIVLRRQRLPDGHGLAVARHCAHPPKPGGGGNGTVCDGCMTCVDQARYVPDPRFDAGALATYKTPYNFNWMDPWHYMVGLNVPRAERVNATVDLVAQLAARWRYGLSLGSTDALNASIDLANAHPEWPLHGVIPGERGQLLNASLPKGCFMQDAAGHLITIKGDRVPPGGKPTLRTMSAKTATAQGCPDALFNVPNGDATRRPFDLLAKTGRLHRSFDILDSDGEVFISLMSPAETYDYSKDPVSAADYAASGQPNWESFWSSWRVRLTNGWSQRILAPLSGSVFKGTRFTMYQVQGDNPYFGNWSITRTIGPKMADAATGRPSYYSTTEPYFTSPHNWWQCSGSYHGICWINHVRPSERALGDELFSPFVNPGWSQQAERNVRPAQWLGLMKVLAAWGAEWFYTSFFSLRAPFQDPANWCWQAFMPVYAQASVVSAAGDMFYKATLVVNDPNTSFAMGDDGTKGSPLLWAGAPHVLALARKLGDSYLVVATAQKLSNNGRNLFGSGRSAVRPSAVHIPGLPTPLLLNVRLFGTVVVVSNTSAPKPSITQLDAWHEGTHPTRWSRGATTYEAELFEGRFLARSAAGARHAGSDGLIVTETPASAAHALDFTTFTTYVDLRAARAPVCLRVHAPPPGPRAAATSSSSRRRRRRVMVLALRGGRHRRSQWVGAGWVTAGTDTGEAPPGWQWLERDEWAVAADARMETADSCLSARRTWIR